MKWSARQAVTQSIIGLEAKKQMKMAGDYETLKAKEEGKEKRGKKHARQNP